MDRCWLLYYLHSALIFNLLICSTCHGLSIGKDNLPLKSKQQRFFSFQTATASKSTFLGPSRSKRDHSSDESTENEIPLYFHRPGSKSRKGFDMLPVHRSFGAMNYMPQFIYVPTEYFVQEQMRRRTILLLQRQQIQEQQLKRILAYLRQLGARRPATAIATGGGTGGGTGAQPVPSTNLPQPPPAPLDPDPSGIFSELFQYLGFEGFDDPLGSFPKTFPTIPDFFETFPEGKSVVQAPPPPPKTLEKNDFLP